MNPYNDTPSRWAPENTPITAPPLNPSTPQKGGIRTLFTRSGVFIITSALLLLVILITLAVLFISDFRHTNQRSQANTGSSLQPPKSGKTTNTAPGSSKVVLPYPTDISPEDIKFTENDKKRLQDIETLGFRILSFSINHSSRYPDDAAEASSVQNKNPLIDPEGQKAYVFVDTYPRRGEVQYKLRANCTKKYREVESNPSNRIWALAMLLDDGSIICKANIFSD